MTAVVKVKGIPITLAGVPYVVPPLSLGALEQLQERLSGFDASAIDRGQIDTRQMSVIIDAAHAALKRNYPALERAALAELIGLENMLEVFEAVMDVSGLKRKAQEAEQLAGEAGAKGAQGPLSTGQPSSPESATAPAGPGTT